MFERRSFGEQTRAISPTPDRTAARRSRLSSHRSPDFKRHARRRGVSIPRAPAAAPRLRVPSPVVGPDLSGRVDLLPSEGSYSATWSRGRSHRRRAGTRQSTRSRGESHRDRSGCDSGPWDLDDAWLGAPAAPPVDHPVDQLQTSCHGVSHGIRADPVVSPIRGLLTIESSIP